MCIDLFASFVCSGCGQDNNNLQRADTLLVYAPKLQFPLPHNGSELHFQMLTCAGGNFAAPFTKLYLVCIASAKEEKNTYSSSPLKHMGQGVFPSYKWTKPEVIYLYLCCLLQPTSFRALSLWWGLVGWFTLTGKAQRREAQVQACLFTVISLHTSRGQGAVPRQGAGGGRLECDRGMPDTLPRRNNYRFQQGRAP